MPGVQSVARFRAHFVVLAMLVAACCCIAGAQAPSAHAYGSTLGSFEIDGNLIDNSGAGEPIDWATPPPNLNNFTDGSGKGDDGFAMGSKETAPSGWTCINQSAPGKDDILSGQIAFRILNGKQYAYVNYFRKAVTGDAHIDYEFNKSTMANPACPSTPARSDGDVVITFDTEQGGKFIFVKLQRWNAATSSFTEISTAGKADGAVNIPANGGLSIPGHKDGDFGEAVINLTDTIGEVTCGQFSTAYMKSRSSTSIDSALQDRTKTQPLNVGLCPQSTLTKGVRNQTTNPTGQYTATTTAKPGDRLSYQVTYKNNGTATATNVVVKDTLSPRQTLVAGTCVAPACTYDAATRTLTWTFDSVAPGATRTVTFEVTLDATFPSGTTEIKNSSVVTTKEEGPTPKTSNETTTTVTSAPNTVPGKGVRNVSDGATTFTSSTTAGPGEIVEYQVTATNTGTSTDSNIVISDAIPQRTTFVSCSNSCTQTGNPVTSVSWTIATLEPGQTVTRTFQVKLESPFTSLSPIVNVSKVCKGTTCKESPPVTVTPSAPKSGLAKAVRNPPGQAGNTGYGTSASAVPGDQVEYRLTYTNSGNEAAANVTITDTIQGGQTFVSCSNSCTNSPANTVSWTFASVPAGGTQVVTFIVKLNATFPNATTTIKNVAVAGTTQEGPNASTSNETTVTVTAAPKSEPGKTARNVTTGGTAGTTISASPGDTIEYTLSYKNAGTSPATNVVLSDPIPNRTTFVSCSDSCTQTGNPVTEVSWTLASVQPGETVTRSFRVKLDDTFPAGATTPVTNVARACIGTTCVSTPPVTVNVKTPSSSTNKDVRLLPDGTFANTASATPGDSLEYRLVYTNSGPGDARDVTLSDEIADGQTFVSCSDSCDSTTTPGTVTWTFGTVPSGATRTVTFIVKLDDAFPAGTTTIENVAVSTTREEGEKPSDKTTVTVTAEPDLELEKSASSPTTGKAVAGEEITYTLAYRNDGDATAAGTTIEETIPAGTEYVSCSPSCSTTGTPVSSVTFTIGSVPAGGDGTVTLTVRVKNDVACQVCNTAQIKSPSQDGGAAINSNQVCLNGVPGPDPSGANASGEGTGLIIAADRSALLGLGSLLNVRLSDVSSSQHGVGTDGDSDTLLDLDPPVPPTLLTAEVIRATTSSSVGTTPARARNTSTATTLDVSVLNVLPLLAGVVEADVVHAEAQATASGDGSSVSAGGTRFAGLKVSGIARENVPPNTTLNVNVVGLTGVKVVLNEQKFSTSAPAAGQTSGGTYTARMEVNGIHITIEDADLLRGGKQAVDIIVSHAVAQADFPQTRLCTSNPIQSVSGHAFIASARTAPDLVDLVHGFAGIPTSGGHDHQSITNLDVTETGGLVEADAVETDSAGTLSGSSSTASSYAQAADVCVVVTGIFGCAVEATLVKSQSNSTATSGARSSNANGTQLVDLKIGGLPIAGTPPPNTVIPLPLGLGVVVLNEQIPDAAAPGHTGLTVRAIRVRLLDPDAGPLGAEVIVAEAHSDAMFQ